MSGIEGSTGANQSVGAAAYAAQARAHANGTSGMHSNGPGGPGQAVANFADLSPVEQGRALAALDAQTGDPQRSNALALDPAGQPAHAAAAHETCTVEVRYTPVALGANHAFIVTTDADSQTYFRGGPAANNEGLNSSSGSSSGDAVSQDFDPEFGIYGPIVTEYGDYRPGTVDWTTDPSGQQTVDEFAGNCDEVDASLAGTMDAIEDARINYMPLHQNSNSTVREGLERAGYPDVDPVVWAPAWNTQLNTN
ncbi:MAG: hypothetical protein AAGL68_03430 [Pseudomonadota bacterium]